MILAGRRIRHHPVFLLPNHNEPHCSNLILSDPRMPAGGYCSNNEDPAKSGHVDNASIDFMPCPRSRVPNLKAEPVE